MKALLIASSLVALFATPASAQMMPDTAKRPMVMQHTPPSPPQKKVLLVWKDSLKAPESIKFDSAQNVYFISNIDGESLKKDGKGFISRMNIDGTSGQLRWIESGKNGVMLNAPKGMAIVGDTLWVSDITTMRAFNRRTGAVIATIELEGQGAAFLNDVAVGPDNAVYVTDTEMEATPTGNMRHPRPDRIFRIANRSATIALQTDRMQRPNGIAWDRGNNRFVIVPFGGDTIMTWRPGAAGVEPLVAGPGQFDGVIVTNEGRLFVSSKATSAIHELRNGKLVKVIGHLNDPADIEYDAARDRIGVPETGVNRVEWYRVPAPN